jgi:hypothetical protein
MNLILFPLSGRDTAGSARRNQPILLILSIFLLMLVAAPLHAAVEPPAVSDEIEKAMDRLIALCGTDGGAQAVDSGAMETFAGFVEIGRAHV